MGLHWLHSTPLKINMEPKINQSKRNIIFQTSMVGFHLIVPRACISQLMVNWWLGPGGLDSWNPLIRWIVTKGVTLDSLTINPNQQFTIYH